MKTRVSLKYFVIDCLQKDFFNPNWPQTSSKLIYLKILVTLRLLTLFQRKIRAIKLQNRAKTSLT